MIYSVQTTISNLFYNFLVRYAFKQESACIYVELQHESGAHKALMLESQLLQERSCSIAPNLVVQFTLKNY